MKFRATILAKQQIQRLKLKYQYNHKVQPCRVIIWRFMEKIMSFVESPGFSRGEGLKISS
ncbi:MAG: hypothetical protein O8C55_13630 [Candidatus Methanoperedens sp.]|nr:hypothetical protein [Candidatus Methanoperedens sp.]